MVDVAAAEAAEAAVLVLSLPRALALADTLRRLLSPSSLPSSLSSSAALSLGRSPLCRCTRRKEKEKKGGGAQPSMVPTSKTWRWLVHTHTHTHTTRHNTTQHDTTRHSTQHTHTHRHTARHSTQHTHKTHNIQNTADLAHVKEATLGLVLVLRIQCRRRRALVNERVGYIVSILGTGLKGFGCASVGSRVT